MAKEFGKFLRGELPEQIEARKMRSICIIDWCGSYKYSGWWCDYFPNENKVVFGGEWEDVPDLTIDHIPTTEECEKHAREHTSFRF